MAVPIRDTAKTVLDQARALRGASLPGVKVQVLEPPDPENPFGVLPKDAQNFDLEITFDSSSLMPIRSGQYIEFYLCWVNGSLIEEADYKKYDFPTDINNISFLVPKRFMVNDGTRELIVVAKSRGGNLLYSTPTLVRIDNTPPNFGAPPGAIVIEEPGFPATGLTLAYLALHPTIRCRIPVYAPREEKDEIHLVLSNTVPVAPFFASSLFKVFATTAEALIVDIPASFFLALKPGAAWITYILKDRYKNTGSPSISTPLTVLFGVAIDLDLPSVSNLYAGLVNRQSARETVQVNIPLRNLVTGDSVSVTWDWIQLPSTQIFNGAPLSFPVAWQVLIANGLGPRTIKVKYTVNRGGGASSSSDLDVRCDYTVAGRDHPLAPAILNTLLDPVEIYGQGSILKNRLTRDHAGFPVTARVVLGNNYATGQVLELYFRNPSLLVSTYTVKATDIAGTVISFNPIPWSRFDSLLNSLNFPIYYTTFNGVNRQQSDDTAVIIESAKLESLAAPQIQSTRMNNYLSCRTTPLATLGVSVKVQANPNIQANDVIRLKWISYSSNNWAPATVAITGVFEYAMKASDLSVGHVFLVPYDPYIQPIQNKGSADVSYEIIRLGSAVYDSLADSVRIDLIEPGTGKACKA